jgi:hypothetical protein
MTWNAYIDIKANGKLNDAHWEEVKKWAEVEQIWSTQGEWDWLVRLRSSISSLDSLEKFVFHLRSQPWVSETRTWWAKAV